MTRFLLTIATFCLFLPLFSQQSNLLQNSSFENRTTDPSCNVSLNIPSPQFNGFAIHNYLDDGCVVSNWDFFGAGSAINDFSYHKAVSCNIPGYCWEIATTGLYSPASNDNTLWNRTAVEPLEGQSFLSFTTGGGNGNGTISSKPGLEQEIGCRLNTGDYSILFDWMCPNQYPKTRQIDFWVNWAENNTGIKVRSFASGTNFPTCQWTAENLGFNFSFTSNRRLLKKSSMLSPCYFAFRGSTQGAVGERHIYFDNLRLFRPCDEANLCSRTSGQICCTAQFAWNSTPGIPLIISQIPENVSKVWVGLYNNAGQTDENTNAMYQVEFQTTNGFFDVPIYFTGRNPSGYLNGGLPDGTYNVVIELRNDCGGTACTYTNKITLVDGLIYDNNGQLITGPAHNTIPQLGMGIRLPKPCCAPPNGNFHVPDGTTLYGFQGSELTVPGTLSFGDNVTVVEVTGTFLFQGQQINGEEDLTIVGANATFLPNTSCKNSFTSELDSFNVFSVHSYPIVTTNENEYQIDEVDGMEDNDNNEILSEVVGLITLSPNPTDHTLHIQTTGGAAYTFHWHNAQGQEINVRRRPRLRQAGAGGRNERLARFRI